MEISCSICHKAIELVSPLEVLRDDRRYRVVYCNNCGIGITVPQPPQEDLARFYAAGSYRLETGGRFRYAVELGLSLFRAQRKNRIRKYAAKGRILDVGCGRGLFLDLMKKGGWEVMGTEIDREVAATIASEYGIPVLHGDLGDCGLPPSSFDVVTLLHVLEHVRNPAETIKECNRLLKKGGLLVVSTPNIRSMQAAAGKKAWLHLDLPYHLYHFSEKGLLDLLRDNSFLAVKVRRFELEYGPFGWLQTLLNLSGIEENLLYNILKNPRLMASERKRTLNLDFLLMLVLLPVYLPASFFLSIFESVLKKAGTVEVYAIKK